MGHLNDLWYLLECLAYHIKGFQFSFSNTNVFHFILNLYTHGAGHHPDFQHLQCENMGWFLWHYWQCMLFAAFNCITYIILGAHFLLYRYVYLVSPWQYMSMVHTWPMFFWMSTVNCHKSHQPHIKNQGYANEHSSKYPIPTCNVENGDRCSICKRDFDYHTKDILSEQC